MAERLDWPGMLRAGLGGLGLQPAAFWALTPYELALKLGLDPGAGVLGRARLEELMRAWPDRRADRATPQEGETPDGGC